MGIRIKEPAPCSVPEKLYRISLEKIKTAGLVGRGNPSAGADKTAVAVPASHFVPAIKAVPDHRMAQSAVSAIAANLIRGRVNGNQIGWKLGGLGVVGHGNGPKGRLEFNQFLPNSIYR